MFYPNVLRLLAHQHAVPLERVHRLWDQAVARSTAPVGVTPDDTHDWEIVMSSFLKSVRCEARVRR